MKTLILGRNSYLSTKLKKKLGIVLLFFIRQETKEFKF